MSPTQPGGSMSRFAAFIAGALLGAVAGLVLGARVALWELSI